MCRAAGRRPGDVQRSACVLVVRHGQTESNREGRFCGHSETPLTPLGIEQARALGGSLVVGVNADDSAQRLNKAPRRPINDAAARARVIAALACVDCVVVFSEDTPETLIEAIEPDVLVKGDDYAASQVPGRAAVERRGGRVHVVPRAAGYSTTAIVERIRAAT